jgi:RNA polymerase sigma-70 factor (ECF subfamily)
MPGPLPHSSPGAGREAFERIVLPLAPGLYRTARRLTRRTDEAVQVTRETILRASRAFDESASPAAARAWLFGLLWATLADLSASEPRNERPPDTPPFDRMMTRVMEGEEPDLDRVLLSRLDASPDVDIALRELSDRDRFALLAVDVEELSYEEAAQALSCPVEEVAQCLLAARAGLFSALFDYARRTSGVRMPAR